MSKKSSYFEFVLCEMELLLHSLLLILNDARRFVVVHYLSSRQQVNER